jgi:Protein of unknown function (DUF2474)
LSAVPPGPLHKRLLWFAAIWFLSVAALALVAFALRFVAAL